MAGAQRSHTECEICFCRGFRGLIRPFSCAACSLSAHTGASAAAPFSSLVRNDHLRVEILVVVLALGRELQVLVAGLWILEDFSFVIPDHDFFVVVIENVTGIDRHFAAAAGSVDDELRYRVTGGM